ncbi:alginate lyase family protein [Mucilaginibacter sp.]|uniref:alginate lyase family protein n=1 Tax=Mucilaginibacter sp. TaxID=1882438 RepID=UPI003265C4B2
MKINISKAILVLILLFLCVESRSQDFVHPGLLTGSVDLARIKKALAANDPVTKAGFEELRTHPQSQFTYVLKGPLPTVGRNPTIGQSIYDSDANAAYQNALMWALTDEPRYAKKAIEIIRAWASTLKTITGRDAVLMAGLGPFKMVNAAELLRYTKSGWTENYTKITGQHFQLVIYPIIKEYAPFANGNWDGAALKTVMAIAIFCNDRAMFNNALNYYQCGVGNGRLTNYIINQNGQCQESGRDQSHTQLGIAHLADCCEMAWQQGIDLYSLQNNLLLKGFEYTAQYNLGYDVVFTPTIDRTGKYLHRTISTEGRGNLRAIYEQVYNHYVHRRGLSAPFTAKAAKSIRPEKQGSPGADHIGFGTILYTRDAPDSTIATPPYRPAGIIIAGKGTGNQLSWPKIINADYYSIKRAVNPHGPFKVIANKVTATEFIDNLVHRGRLYYYTINAVNKNGQGQFSVPISIYAGLPFGWKVTDLDSGLTTNNALPKLIYSTGKRRGTASFDESFVNINAVGIGVDSLVDHATLLYLPLNHPNELVIKYVPQFSAQTTQFGLTFRDGTHGNAAAVTLLLRPISTLAPEEPKWGLQFLSRGYQGALLKAAPDVELQAPFVTFGRMTGPIWLKLSRKGNRFNGSYSTDSLHWLDLGSITFTFKRKPLIGIIAASGTGLIDTEIKFSLR